MNTGQKYYGLMNDMIFKYVFGRNENTKPIISLLNAILRLEGKNRIENVEILNPFNYQEYKDEKLSIVDTKVKDDKGFLYNIEMQNYKDQAFEKRMGYYLSKLYSTQLDYDLPKTANGIVFMDFDLFKSNKLHEKFMFKNETSNITIKDFITLHFINVSKTSLKKDINNQTLYYRWLKTLRYSEDYDKMKDELNKLIKDDEGMQIAIELMDQANADLKMKMLLFDREESKRYSRYIINSQIREKKAAGKKLKAEQEKRKIAEKKLEKTTEEAIEKLIQTCKAFDDTKEQTVKKIMHAYKLTEADATSKVEQYWNDNN